MKFEFSIDNCVIDGSKIGNNIHGLPAEAKISLRGSQISESELFNNLDVSDFRSQISREDVLSRMSSPERSSIENVLKNPSNSRSFRRALMQHLLSFAEGVAASVAANFLFR